MWWLGKCPVQSGQVKIWTIDPNEKEWSNFQWSEANSDRFLIDDRRAGETLSQNFLGHVWQVWRNHLMKRTKQVLKPPWRNNKWPYLPVFKIPHYLGDTFVQLKLLVQFWVRAQGHDTWDWRWWKDTDHMSCLNRWLWFKIIDLSKCIMPILATKMQHNATINWRSNTIHTPGAAALNPFKAAFHGSASPMGVTRRSQKLTYTKMDPKNDDFVKRRCSIVPFIRWLLD